MNKNRPHSTHQLEGVSDKDPLLQKYEKVGREFLEGCGIDVSKTADELNQLFAWTLLDQYLKPTLKHVKQDGVRDAAEHARRIGVNRSTTSGWWNLYAENKTSRVGNPELKTFLYTLVAFHINPINTLPHGRDVVINLWQVCIGYMQRQLDPKPQSREIAPDELLCLHLVFQSEEWKKEHYSDAANFILPTIKLFYPGSKIDALPSISSVVREWFNPTVIVFSLLKTKWLLE